MPRRPKHPCPGDGHQRCGMLVHTPRCPAHTHGYDHAERQRMANTVTAWVQANGYTCPGYQRDPHPSGDLTAEHTTPVSQGGSGGPLSVLCRSCNARRGAGTE